MNDEQLLRYSRHILLPEIGIEGQERLLAARALVIGAGGLGSPVALYLAAAASARITLCDGDAVDLTNLQRQIVHRTRIGRPQEGGIGARHARRDQSRSRGRRRWRSGWTATALEALAARPTWCSTAATTSPPATRSTAPASSCSKPLVSGAAVRFDGQVAVFDLRRPDRRATPACFPKTAKPRRCAAR